jgi:hypothetical protein
MKHDDVDRRLRAALTPKRRDADPRLREELLTAHRRAYPNRKKWTVMTHKTWFRPVLAGVALTVLGIAACTAPTDYDVEMGKQVNIAFANPDKSLPDLESQFSEVRAYIDALPAVEGSGLMIECQPGGPSIARITVWGQNLDGDAFVADLEARFPFLQSADITLTPLEGTASGTLADRFGHDVFHVEVHGETAEEIRLQILEQLASQGLGGDPQVEVIDRPDGRREIRVEMQCEQGATKDAAEGCRTIEIKQN